MKNIIAILIFGILIGCHYSSSTKPSTETPARLSTESHAKPPAETKVIKDNMINSIKAVGKVKWFNDKKGFGFISVEGGEDVFVHHTAIEGDEYRTLAEGDMVEFVIVQSYKGNKAENVRKLK